MGESSRESNLLFFTQFFLKVSRWIRHDIRWKFESGKGSAKFRMSKYLREIKNHETKNTMRTRAICNHGYYCFSLNSYVNFSLMIGCIPLEMCGYKTRVVKRSSKMYVSVPAPFLRFLSWGLAHGALELFHLVEKQKC